MTTTARRFLLFSEVTSKAGLPVRVKRQQSLEPDPRADSRQRYWHFRLRSPEGSTCLDVADRENDATEERLELLAVVRGLEALDQPSHVTLVTASGSIHRGLRFGLDTWRENQWHWERFGRMTPVKNADLWRRIDRALEFHEIECRLIRFDAPVDDLTCAASRRGKRSPGADYGRSVDVFASQAGTCSCREIAGHWRAPRLIEGVSRFLRCLFSWCGLCRSESGLVIAPH